MLKSNRIQNKVLEYVGEDGKTLHLYVGNENVYCYLIDRDGDLMKTRTIKKCRSDVWANSPMSNTTYNARLLWKLHHARNYFVTQGAGNMRLVHKNKKLLEEMFPKWIADTFKIEKC